MVERRAVGLAATPPNQPGGQSGYLAESNRQRMAGNKAVSVIAQWAWELIEPYLRKNLATHGVERPTRKQLLEEFGRAWPDFFATILVQEPWMGTIRFKRLVKLPASEMAPFLAAPERFIVERFGGGKFKMNLHHGMHFVSTKNFKPDGPPLWRDLPELREE
jgi:hypothetical protein